jgi:hypothetical protein
MNSVSYQGNLGFPIVRHINPKVLWDTDAYGVPFIYYYTSSGLPPWSIFSWVEALVNLAVAVTCSILLGLAFAVLKRRQGAPRD